MGYDRFDCIIKQFSLRLLVKIIEEAVQTVAAVATVGNRSGLVTSGG